MLTGQRLSSLITEIAQEGFELPVKLARMGVNHIQPSDEIRGKLRPAYEENVVSLIASSQLVATHFQAVAAANKYWSNY